MNIAPLICAMFLTGPGDRDLNFDSQIVPILTKAGCNAGACHGAAAGRGGFNLSLLGSDPAADYDSIVHQFEGRRVNLASPAKSLLLAKPTGFLDHGGEVVFDVDSREAKRLRDWIAAGAPRGKPRELTRFEVIPNHLVTERSDNPIPLKAIASFDSGPEEDVTSDVLFTSTDKSAIEIDLTGPSVKISRSGQLIIIARYLDRVVPVEFLVPYSNSQSSTSASASQNLIDREIFGLLKTLRIPVSQPASDAAYLRRVTLDLTGRLPTYELAEAFPKDPALDKRQRLVDALLASEEFNDYWTYRLARSLRLHSLPNDKKGVEAYAAWLREQIQKRTPFSEVASSLLTATGDSHVVGPANFARMVRDPRAHAELVGQVFLGVRLGCANCHNHPLDRWTQDDFHGFAAVFAKLQRDRIVKLVPYGETTNLRTGAAAIPRIPGQQYLSGNSDHRVTIAKWLTKSDDRQFARAVVNRLWQAMMGRGLVEPIDDMRETNPATHPALLAKLAEDFAAHNYDLRHTLRLIALSEAYALSHESLPQNQADNRFYSHAYAKPMPPEVLADAIAEVLDVPNGYGNKEAGTKALTILDPLDPAPLLDILGRCNRTADCDGDEARSRGLAAELHLLNGDFINQKLTTLGSRVGRMIGKQKSSAEVVREFYLRGLSREPTPGELKNWENRLKSFDEADRQKKIEDFVWSLLCSQSFTENR
jgi:hypothetical protein